MSVGFFIVSVCIWLTNPNPDVKFYGSQQNTSFYHDSMAIISLHLPTVNDHVIAKATMGVFREGYGYRFLNQLWDRWEHCMEKRLWYPREWVCGGSPLWFLHFRNKQYSARENPSFGHDIFPTWVGRQCSAFDLLFVEDVLAECFEAGYDKMPAEHQAQSLTLPMVKQFYMVLKIFWNCILGSNHKKRYSDIQSHTYIGLLQSYLQPKILQTCCSVNLNTQVS